MRNLSWNDRFALIEHFKPSDQQVLAAFGLTQDELETARQLQAVGTFRATSSLDLEQFSGVFTNVQLSAPTMSTAMSAAASSMKASEPIFASSAAKPTIRHSTATTHSKPETATKKIKEPQKRGRKGNRIQMALAAVPTTPVPAEDFSKEHTVSIAVLRQAKRFLAELPADVQAQIGNVCVRQDKATKTLMIWRELPKAE